MSLLQSLDRGIIWSLKILYQKSLIFRLVFDMDQKWASKAIAVRTAIDMPYEAWNNVTVVTVRNCFVNSCTARGRKTVAARRVCAETSAG